MISDMVDPSMLHDTLSHAVPQWAQLAYQGIADSAIAPAPPQEVVCPAFGQPGWGPFCFLNGNPVFKAFDVFQGYVQSLVVGLHDTLEAQGVKNAYGPSIVLFTFLVRTILFPLNFFQISSTTMTQSLTPKVQEIKEKYADNQDLQNQMTALLYEETKVNPLAGCLPALAQIPIFLSMYRSFFNLAQEQRLDEPFLWLPNLEGPVYGERSTAWITEGWVNGVPSLGWHDTLMYLTIPVLLFAAQSVSMRILTPPSDDPAIQKSQQFLKYLPLMVSYFSLSVPSGLGIYWITSNIVSTATTASIKAYLNANPPEIASVDLDQLANSMNSAYMNPTWGYSSEKQMIDEAILNYRPARTPKIPADFV